MKRCGENISLNFGPRNLLTTQEKLANLKSTAILLTLVDVVLNINSTKTSEEIFNFKQSISLHLTLCLSELHPFDIFAKECNVSVILGGNLIFFSCWLLAAYMHIYAYIYARHIMPAYIFAYGAILMKTGGKFLDRGNAGRKTQVYRLHIKHSNIQSTWKETFTFP